MQGHCVWGHDRVYIFNQLISDEPNKSLGIKTEYMPRAVVRLDNIFNCLAYEWTVLIPDITIWLTIVLIGTHNVGGYNRQYNQNLIKNRCLLYLKKNSLVIH
jgi:hypothetical protein